MWSSIIVGLILGAWTSGGESSDAAESPTQLGEWIAEDWSLDSLNELNESDELPTVKSTSLKDVVVLPELSKLFTEIIARNVQEEWQGRKLPFFDIRVLQLNLSISNLKIAQIEAPNLRFELSSLTPDDISTNRVSPVSTKILHIVGNGGSALIRGAYRAVYRNSRVGQLAIEIHGFHLDIRFRLQRAQSRRIQLLPLTCTAAATQIDLTLLPVLIDDVEAAIEQKLQEELSNYVCNQATRYVQFADQQLQLRGISTPFDEINETQ
ncbi:hypothetical protein M3Y94_01144700 [Aphelenchoides besseyi]|nr:hypothetical protein M3Y94_01144700 [Aphelenchoides besseyi]KAI6227899.1 hypothetical protein M3Y95_00565400 [Aphelenchoides besseyi]